jgi:hypothetical protein
MKTRDNTVLNWRLYWRFIHFPLWNNRWSSIRLSMLSDRVAYGLYRRDDTCDAQHWMNYRSETSTLRLSLYWRFKGNTLYQGNHWLQL